MFLKQEGQRWSVTCKDTNRYAYQQKCWCRIKSKGDCVILVSSSREQAAPLFFSWPNYNGYFTITITVLTVEDSERYCCGNCQSSQFSVSKCRVFQVSQGEFCLSGGLFTLPEQGVRHGRNPRNHFLCRQELEPSAPDHCDAWSQTHTSLVTSSLHLTHFSEPWQFNHTYYSTYLP